MAMNGHLSQHLHGKTLSIEGVGMIPTFCTIKLLNIIEKIQLRMMVAMFNSSPSTTIISCYSPTNERDLITYYNELSYLVCSIPKHNILIIGEDMNTQIGKDENNKFCLHNLFN